MIYRQKDTETVRMQILYILVMDNKWPSYRFVFAIVTKKEKRPQKRDLGYFFSLMRAGE